MRGYFGIGVERFSKPANAGNLFRTAHAFGAGFLFTIASDINPGNIPSDTSESWREVPFYSFASPAAMELPQGCSLVGVELSDEALELPSFRHPRSAAYVLGAERYSLSPELVERCHHVVRIPTRFSLNVATAGAIVMYDRLIAQGRFAGRPVALGGAPQELAPHVRGEPVRRRRGPA
jgi:tRNA G18 (ribose-2'-O)-methylase SpoU